MEMSQLTILLQVVRQGSFARVAREIGVTPSSVSRAISTLEAELGFRLLQRTTRQLSLTEAGARYVDRIGPLVTGLEDAQRFAQDAESTPSGVGGPACRFPSGSAVSRRSCPPYNGDTPTCVFSCR